MLRRAREEAEFLGEQAKIINEEAAANARHDVLRVRLAVQRLYRLKAAEDEARGTKQ